MRVKYYGRAESPTGDAIASATVKIYLAGTSTPATAYTTVASTTPVSQVTTDQYGYYTFYINAFDYDQSQLFDLVLNKLGSATTYTFYNIQSDNIIPGTYDIDENTVVSGHVYIPKGVVLNISNGIVLTFSVMPEIGLYTVFTGDGTVQFPNGCRVYIDWWGDDLTTVVANIATANATVVISDTVAVAANIVVPSNICLLFEPPGKLDIETGYTVTIGELSCTTLYQIFDGAGTVVFGAGAVKEVYPEWWGTDAAAITSAAASLSKGVVKLLATTYTVDAEITLGANVTLKGSGKSATKLDKGFSGDVLTFASGSCLEDLEIDGNGGTCTGRGVVVSAGYGQHIDNCNIHDMESYCVEYPTQDVGSQSYIINSTLSRTALGIAIKYPSTADTQAIPRSIINCQANGGTLVDFAAANNYWFIGNRTNELTFSSGDGQEGFVIGNRIGNLSTVTIRGHEIHVVGNSFASAVVLDTTALSCIFHSNIVPSWAITDNGSGNSVQARQLAYTPTWNQASGIQPDLGNGTITGVWSRDGGKISVEMRLVTGSTTTYGNSSAGYQFSLPKAASSDIDIFSGVAYIYDASDEHWTAYRCAVGSGGTVVTINEMDASGGLARLDNPIIWDTGDIIEIKIEYWV